MEFCDKSWINLYRPFGTYDTKSGGFQCSLITPPEKQSNKKQQKKPSPKGQTTQQREQQECRTPPPPETKSRQTKIATRCTSRKQDHDTAAVRTHAPCIMYPGEPFTRSTKQTRSLRVLPHTPTATQHLKNSLVFAQVARNATTPYPRINNEVDFPNSSYQFAT